MTIPASAIVNVIPGVIGAGGTGLDLSGLVLVGGTIIPVGAVYSFPNVAAVSALFGPTHPLVAFAEVYFAGYDNSTRNPAALLATSYNTSAVTSHLFSSSLAAMTLAQLQALSGTLTISRNGAPITSSTINLSTATSLAAAAPIIQAAFPANSFNVVYDTFSGELRFYAAGGSGAGNTISYASGTLATALSLTQATGAVISQAADPSTPVATMNNVLTQATNWASFTTLFEATASDKLGFAAWANAQDNSYAYVMWDSGVAQTQFNDTTSVGYQIQQANYSGTILLYALDASKPAFVMGCAASFDYTRANGRSTLAFKGQSGLTADVTTSMVAYNLIQNGWNFYGAYSTAAQGFVFLYNGQITGSFDWADSYYNQIWLNNAFQLALMELLTTVTSIPYNDTGYNLIKAALLDPIQAALNYGAIRPGVTLSNAQIAEVNGAAGGLLIADTLQSRGWYLLVADATPQVRGARGSPPCTFFYVDGESVQQINLASVEVQ